MASQDPAALGTGACNDQSQGHSVTNSRTTSRAGHRPHSSLSHPYQHSSSVASHRDPQGQTLSEANSFIQAFEAEADRNTQQTAADLNDIENIHRYAETFVQAPQPSYPQAPYTQYYSMQLISDSIQQSLPPSPSTQEILYLHPQAAYAMDQTPLFGRRQVSLPQP